MRPPSAAQSRAGAVAPAPRGFPVVACPDSIARDTRCLLLTHTSITPYEPLPEALPRLRESVLHVAADLRTLGRAEEIGLDLHRARDLVERLRGEMRID